MKKISIIVIHYEFFLMFNWHFSILQVLLYNYDIEILNINIFTYSITNLSI